MRNAVVLAVVGLGVFAWAAGRAAPRDRGESGAVAVAGDGARMPAGAGAADNLIVAELFTSQGCSSCPPADELLAELGKQSDVLPLAFHVDYWNYIGWSDPFSSPAWSERQRAYRRARGFRTYTPQLVIDGQADAVGSRRGAVEAALTRARQRARKTPAVPIEARAQRTGNRILVDVAARGGAGEVFVAVFDSGLRTTVSRGENRGRALDNHYIVRHLERAARRGAKKPTRLSIPVDASWKGTLGVAVFVQDPKTMAIHGARALRL